MRDEHQDSQDYIRINGLTDYVRYFRQVLGCAVVSPFFLLWVTLAVAGLINHWPVWLCSGGGLLPTALVANVLARLRRELPELVADRLAESKQIFWIKLYFVILITAIVGSFALHRIGPVNAIYWHSLVVSPLAFPLFLLGLVLLPLSCWWSVKSCLAGVVIIEESVSITQSFKRSHKLLNGRLWLAFKYIVISGGAIPMLVTLVIMGCAVVIGFLRSTFAYGAYFEWFFKWTSWSNAITLLADVFGTCLWLGILPLFFKLYSVAIHEQKVRESSVASFVIAAAYVAFVASIVAVMTWLMFFPEFIQIAKIKGYHNPWPAKVLCASRNVEEGQKIERQDLELRTIGPEHRAPVDALCFPEEAIGVKAAYPLPAGEVLTFHNFACGTVKQRPEGSNRPSDRTDTKNSVTIVVSHRNILKGNLFTKDNLAEARIPIEQVPIDASATIYAVIGHKSFRDIPAHQVISNHDVQPAQVTAK